MTEEKRIKQWMRRNPGRTDFPPRPTLNYSRTDLVEDNRARCPDCGILKQFDNGHNCLSSGQIYQGILNI